VARLALALMALLGVCAACVGAGAALQDAGMPGLGAGAGAGVGLASGGSSFAVVALAAFGAFVMSLVDQSAEGQIALGEAAPLGLWPILDLLFWPIVIAVAVCWITPTPLAFFRGGIRALKLAAKHFTPTEHHRGSKNDRPAERQRSGGRRRSSRGRR